MNNYDAIQLIEAIQESQKPLTKWEEDFLQSIEEQLDNGDRLSDKQSDALQKIYRKSQGG